MEKFKHLAKNKTSELPKTAGVYAFFFRLRPSGEGGKRRKEIVYIGKAKNLRERVKNHNELLGLAEQLGYIKTGSEIEALILEANLIKKYQPKYNIAWRDDKNYFYICIDGKDLPRVFITHQINENCSRYIGPFVEGSALKKTLRMLRRVFPYYTAKKHPARLCPWCHINLCPGPKPNKKEYQKNIKNLSAVLRGKKKSVLINLKREMGAAAKKQNFEKAARIKDQIAALEKVLAHTRIFALKDIRFPLIWRQYQKIEAYDVSDIQGKEAAGAMVVFINGKPDKSQYRKFKIKIAGKPNDVAMLQEVLSRRLKHKDWPYPDLILVDGGRSQLNAAKKIIKKIPVMALAKKKNELFIENQKKPRLLKKLPRETFNLILQLKNEAHRFAQKYHHNLRKVDFFFGSWYH